MQEKQKPMGFINLSNKSRKQRFVAVKNLRKNQCLRRDDLSHQEPKVSQVRFTLSQLETQVEKWRQRSQGAFQNKNCVRKCTENLKCEQISLKTQTNQCCSLIITNCNGNSLFNALSQYLRFVKDGRKFRKGVMKLLLKH